VGLAKSEQCATAIKDQAVVMCEGGPRERGNERLALVRGMCWLGLMSHHLLDGDTPRGDLYRASRRNSAPETPTASVGLAPSVSMRQVRCQRHTQGVCWWPFFTPKIHQLWFSPIAGRSNNEAYEILHQQHPGGPLPSAKRAAELVSAPRQAGDRKHLSEERWGMRVR